MSWWDCIFDAYYGCEHPGGSALTERGAEVCGFRPGQKVLDVAAGNGSTMRFLRDKFLLEAEGVDLNPRGEGVSAGDAEALPYPDRCFDGLCMECALSEMEHPDAALSECFRVLRPGGKLLFSGLYAKRGKGYEKSPLGRIETEGQLLCGMRRAGLRPFFFEDHTREMTAAAAEALMQGKAAPFFRQLNGNEQFRIGDAGYCMICAGKESQEAAPGEERGTGEAGPGEGTAAVIAAAGLSSRMGDFKQLMKLGDYGFAERIVRTFQAAGIRRIAVVTGHRAEELEKALSGYGVAFLHNPDYASTEMLDSARLGFRYFEDAEKLLFTPSDVPLFTEETVRNLLRVPLPENGKAVVYPAVGRQTGHPVLIGGSLLKELLSCPADGGLRKAFLSVGAKQIYLPVEDAGTLYDADTPEAYARLKKLASKSSTEL